MNIKILLAIFGFVLVGAAATAYLYVPHTFDRLFSLDSPSHVEPALPGLDGDHTGHAQMQHDGPLDPIAIAPLGSASPAIKYVCPMHPQIVQDEQGHCPICGMSLEPVEVGAAAQEVSVNVAGGMQQALGLRTEAVTADDTLWRYVRALGSVEYDQDAIHHIHPRMTGWVESVSVVSEGDYVKKGQKLFDIYSPELVNAQDDYLLARNVLSEKGRNGDDLLRRARLRLELLGISDKTIKQLEKRGKSFYRVPFYAPYEGMVSKLELREGMFVEPGSTLMELVDLSRVWVLADVFENEQSWLEVGRPAEVTASAQGLFDIEGHIDYIYPELDATTRAMRVRVVLDNPEQKLRPGTLVDVELFGGPKRQLLTVPTEALIMTGRENRVVVQRDDNSFASVTVKLGMISQGRAEVLEGLQAGDRVVVSGQFLLDSEASIQGSLQRLSGSNAGQTAADPHAGHGH
ncbi:efflux RND transporter periplasmic adaptor subunit [Corallincola luteus]|uniref:Efflux RND transporter periplasmic adaptor subunit n=1 Tax=Corallincola luteus TaxID=1775177 RepID=A0ABY2AGT6_9GAMM|nr:efflux RND transporter periplasmic adaptor subunit [Corallincola luteus]TCI01774.1 efflux RND transporter periplasmic adaptor subunit [Corallincola luteus]